MKVFQKYSLKLQVITLGLVMIFMTGLGSFWNMLNVEKDYKHMLGNIQKSYANQLGSSVAALFYERYGDVQAFAVNPYVQSLDHERLPKLLDQYIGLYGIYDLIVVVDKNGRLIATNTKASSGEKIDSKAIDHLEFNKMKWFKAVVENQLTEDRQKGFVGTFVEDFERDPVMSVAVGKDYFGSGFSAAIRDDKRELIGVISNRVNKSWFEKSMLDLGHTMKSDGFNSIEMTITNKDGLIVAFLEHDEKGDLALVTDSKRILSAEENFDQKHVLPGKGARAGETGFVESQYQGEDVVDLVGYHFMKESKWIETIGWKTYVHSETNEIYQPVIQAKNFFYLVLLFCSIAALILCLWFSSSISRALSEVANLLKTNTAEVSSASTQIATAATQLSESSTQQSSAIQQTVSAIEEISAMVEKNAEAASRSKEVSSQSQSATEMGQQKVETMMNAIQEIGRSNEEVSKQMEATNSELSEITRLIGDISSKTKVIDEIVFQTKLLSFNASVEAARAGEYGKGFAVVAEEVGHLAQMSGNSAKEIASLLAESERKVETIVKESKVRIEKLVLESKEKVEAGNHTAEDCSQALNTIRQNVQSVDSLLSEIAVASSEQSTGIREISKAIGQMEQVTTQNSLVAQSSSSAGQHLHKQSQDLNVAVHDLVEVIHGKTGA